MKTTADLVEIVKSMERGQITIPVKIRERLGIGPQTWLWVKLVGDKILIEPVENNKEENFSRILNKIASDTNKYWSKQDDQALRVIKKRALQRLKRLLR